MDSLINILEFIQGVILETDVGPFIIALTFIYLYIKFKEAKQKKHLKHLQTYVTIRGRQVIRGKGISIKLKSDDGWKTGVFLGANDDGFLIIKTDNNSKIVVDPNYVSDIRVFDAH